MPKEPSREVAMRSESIILSESDLGYKGTKMEISRGDLPSITLHLSQLQVRQLIKGLEYYQ